MVTRIAISPTWIVSQKIVFPIKKILAAMQEVEYASVGAIMQSMESSDILFLNLLFAQHMEETAFYSRAGLSHTDELAVYNISVLTVILLVAEGVTEVTPEDAYRAKVRLGNILAIEAAIILQSVPRINGTYTLKRTNYNLSSEKDLSFLEFQKDED